MKSRAKKFFEKRKTVLAIFNATITLRTKQHIDALSI